MPVPPARAKAKSANLDSPRCVESKLVLFYKSPEVSGSKNTVCLPAPIQILKIIIQILRGVSCAVGT